MVRSLLWALALVILVAACGARSQFIGPQPTPSSDVVSPDATDRTDVRADSRSDARDVLPDIPVDALDRIDVVCPAAIHSTQTTTVPVVARATSSLGLPLTYAWTLERGPMDSTLRPAPANALATSVTFDMGGEWVLRFTATDPQGHGATCTVNLYAEPAIQLLCPNDESNFQGANLSLLATARSRLGRTLTYAWTVESRPTASMSAPVPPDQLAIGFRLDQLGDWQLRLIATDSGGLSASCRVNLHADPDVIVTCPPDVISRPFATINLTGTASSRLGLPLTYSWEIVSQPITSTATLPSPGTISTPFTFDVAGNWTYRFTASNARGNHAFCTTRALAATDEAVRIETVWNTDRSCRSCNAEGGGIDIDLHVANVSLAGGHWDGNAPMSGDCYYANCQCGMPGMLCPVESIDWPPAGALNNPQQDVDHISDLPGPENINIRQAEVGAQFDIGVHFFGSSVGATTTPVVTRVYCAGTVVFESEAVALELRAPMASSNNLWRVGRITITPGGCTFERCGAPGMLTACIRPQDDW